MKILLIYVPFCTPASPPYSITNLYSFLKNNSKEDIEVLDLNLEFHKLKFPEYQEYYSGAMEDYDKTTTEYRKSTAKTYAINNKAVVKGKTPEFFDEILEMITSKKPDLVAFSLVYSSQVFWAKALIEELEMRCVIGGPAVSQKLTEVADAALNNEVELLEYISQTVNHEKLKMDALDFSAYDLDGYFTPKPVIPLKITSTCFYRGCTFCSHPNVPYFEYSLDTVKSTIVKSNQKFFFLIDDMIPVKHLLKFAAAVKPLEIKWTCQLRPTKDLTQDALRILKEAGLVMIIWGVESGNDRVLNMIKKGTNKADIAQVLSDSHTAGIRNVLYIMFGFPTETKEELLETIDFLKENDVNIDLISTSVFGLQYGTYIYNNPEKFGIRNIVEKERTVLGPNITYDVESGLTQNEASELRRKYQKTIDKFNKYPKTMNFFREHMLIQSSKLS